MTSEAIEWYNISNHTINKKNSNVNVPTINLDYPTSHLNGFEELSDSIGLFGDEYTLIKKAVWYNLHSMKIADKELNLGQINVDGRIPLLIVMNSGSGKNEIKGVIKNMIRNLGLTFIEPTSFHPEQFVGKVEKIQKKDKIVYNPLPGHLSRDYIVIDEGKDLLTSKKEGYSESRKYLRVALDPYPTSEITKKSVNIGYGNSLNYTAKCNVSIFVQPYRFDEEFVLDGDIRRFNVLYVPMNKKNKSNVLLQRVHCKTNSKQALVDFSTILKQLPDLDEFKMDSNAIDRFLELAEFLVSRGENHPSNNIRNYTSITFTTMQNNLFKYSAIQALQEHKNVIESKHVELAFIDLFEILEHTYDFIQQKISGQLDYGEGWGGAQNKEQSILQWLYNQGATNEQNTTISIADYKSKICTTFNVEDRQASRILKEHKDDKGWIDTKKGQHTSKVWLKIEPKLSQIDASRVVRVVTETQEKYDEIKTKHKIN